MNFATFERAQVASFAYRQAARTGTLDCLRAVCYVIRNRVKAGWGDGTWLSVIDAHFKVTGNSTLRAEMPLDPQSRLLQLIVRDIDDIYLGASSDDTKTVVQDALYYQFIDMPPREWFVENIVWKTADHPRIAQIGPIAFFR